MSSSPLSTVRFLQGENSRLQSENQKLSEKIANLQRSLHDIQGWQASSSRLQPESDVESWLNGMLGTALSAIQATAGSLLLVDEDAQELLFAVVHGPVGARLIGERMPLSEGIAGWVATHRKQVAVPNARIDPRFSGRIDRAFSFETRTLICAPIIEGTRVLGVLQALNKANDRPFDGVDTAIFGLIASLAAPALEKADMLLANAPTAVPA